MIDANPLDQERGKRQRQRNWAVFLALAGFAVLIYAITVVKIRQGYGG